MQGDLRRRVDVDCTLTGEVSRSGCAAGNCRASCLSERSAPTANPTPSSALQDRAVAGADCVWHAVRLRTACSTRQGVGHDKLPGLKLHLLRGFVYEHRTNCCPPQTSRTHSAVFPKRLQIRGQVRQEVQLSHTRASGYDWVWTQRDGSESDATSEEPCGFEAGSRGAWDSSRSVRLSDPFTQASSTRTSSER